MTLGGNLTELNTFKIGGTCRSLAFPKSLEELILVLKEKKDAVILGNGSNVLIFDGYIDKDFIVTTKLNKISNNLEAECGTNFSTLCELACEKKLSGLEYLYKIPGTVGGCLCMNAGAFEHSISDVVKEIKIYDKNQDKVIKLSADDCHYGYKKSIFIDKNLVILSATFNLKNDSYMNIKKIMDEVKFKREKTQPKDPSAGSFFKRPSEQVFASKLIDECGLKGYRIGDAVVSTKHAGFICNIGNATFNDVINVSEHVKTTVLNKTGIQIEPEVIIIK